MVLYLSTIGLAHVQKQIYLMMAMSELLYANNDFRISLQYTKHCLIIHTRKINDDDDRSLEQTHCARV